MALPASGPISFSQLKSELNLYSTELSGTQISLSNSKIRDLLSGPTATSGAPYAAGTQISMSQSVSKSWRVSLSSSNSGTIVSTVNLTFPGLPGLVKTNRPVAFSYTNSGTIIGSGSSYESNSINSAAIYIAGSWPAGSSFVINNSGTIVGKGGSGGSGGYSVYSGGVQVQNGYPGGNGGCAVLVYPSNTSNLTVYLYTLAAGQYLGGGGGGGGAGGNYFYQVPTKSIAGGYSMYGGGGGGGGAPNGSAGGGGNASGGSRNNVSGAPGAVASYSLAGSGGAGGATSNPGGSGGNPFFGASAASGATTNSFGGSGGVNGPPIRFKAGTQINTNFSYTPSTF